MNQRQPHLLVMAGGTGGHVFPALAVAKLMQSRGVKVTWLGTQKGLEATVIPNNNIDIKWITIHGLRGKGLLSWLLAPFKLMRAVWQSIKVLRLAQPNCVLGMGGFVAGPGGLASRLLGTPLVIHEQNAVAGLTNRMLAKIAQCVLTGFPKVADLPNNAVWVGNPVREEIENLALSKHREAQSPLRVLVIGGSQGAHSLNLHCPSAFANHRVKLDVWHQCGQGRQDEVTERYVTAGIQAKVTEFIDDMSSAYAWADFLVCRAGAMTIAECCAAAKPALLVPYPHSAGAHQDRNADFMVTAGAAVSLQNDQLNSDAFQRALHALTHDSTKLLQMGKAAYSLHKSHAADSVAKYCEEFFHA